MDLNEAYKTLELKIGASAEEVKKAYRRLAALHHPDKNQGSKDSEDKFKKISEAYESITKPQPERQVPPGFNDTFNDSFFNFGFRGPPEPVKKKSPPKSVIRMHNAEIAVPVDILNVLLRSPIEVRISADCACTDCLSDEAGWSVCQNCSQTGVISRVIRIAVGNIRQQHDCTVCKGTGWVYAKNCKTCKGKLIYFKEKILSVTFPKEYKSGSLRLPNGGREGWNAPASDLIINPILKIPDYSTLSAADKAKLASILDKI